MTIQKATNKVIHLKGSYRNVARAAKKFIAHGYRCAGFVAFRRNGRATATVVLERSEVGR